MADNRNALIVKIRELSQEAIAVNEMAAASILLALAGSLHASMERELMSLTSMHTEAVIARISAIKERHSQAQYHKHVLDKIDDEEFFKPESNEGTVIS